MKFNELRELEEQYRQGTAPDADELSGEYYVVAPWFPWFSLEPLKHRKAVGEGGEGGEGVEECRRELWALISSVTQSGTCRRKCCWPFWAGGGARFATTRGRW
mgnify:CR=1 FL=1